MRNFKVALIAKHPVQILLPLYKQLAHHAKVDLKIFFGSNYGIETGRVPIVQHGITVKLYDAPDLSDIAHKFLKNYGTSPAATGFWSPVNPGIWQELRKETYDAILIHGYGTLMDIIAYIAARATKTPIMMMGETYLRQDRMGWMRILKDFYVRSWLKGVQVCLPIGTISRRFYHYYDVPNEKFFTVPYSVDNDFIQNEANKISSKRDEIKSKYGILLDSPTILFVGRLIDRKHPMDLIQAFRRVGEDANLVIVGDGPQLQHLKDFVGQENLKGIFLVGYKTPPETREFFAIADIFVLPSSFEPWGLVVNEAMCFGLPIIAADGVAAAFDLVCQEENGYVFPSRDIDALAFHLESLVNNPEKRRKMGSRSREIIATWNYDVAVERIVDALNYLTS